MNVYRIEWRDHKGAKQEPVFIEAATAADAQLQFFKESAAGAYYESMSEVSDAKG